MTRRGTTDSTENLQSGALILIKNGLIYSPLYTELLSSLDPSSDYLAITVKIKGTSAVQKNPGKPVLTVKNQDFNNKIRINQKKTGKIPV